MLTLGIDRPILVVCEGPSDCGLINALLQHHQISGIRARCPQHGFSAIEPFLRGLETQSAWQELSGLLLVADANGDPLGRFEETARILTKFGLPVTQAFQLEHGGQRNTGRAVYLMPGPGRPGCLEDLLLDAIHRKSPNLIRCVDGFESCVQLSGAWNANDRAKMRVHSLMAACCEEEPATALSRVWHKRGNPIPIESPVFDELVSWLRRFEALVASC